MHSYPFYDIFIGSEQIKILNRSDKSPLYMDFRDLKKKKYFLYFGKNIRKKVQHIKKKKTKSKIFLKNKEYFL